MKRDEARDLFSDAFEGSLDAAQRQAFDAALADDSELAEEYRDFAHVLELTRQTRNREVEAPNLLPAVQRRLRNRSRGRYYRDRFAQKVGSGGVNPWLLAAAMVAVLALAWLGLSLLDSIHVDTTRLPGQ